MTRSKTVSIHQRGGYVKGSRLNVTDQGDRTFSEVLPDGTLRGQYTYQDRKEPGKKAYRTPWMPVAHKVYTERCTARKKELGISRGDYFCEPMIIRLQETTPGNNKHNLQKRQRKYYVIQEFYPEPRKVGNRSYYYEPRSWFMKLDESPLQFLSRMYGEKNEKRKFLPPIPENLLDKVERKIMLENFDPNNQKDPVKIAEEQEVTTSTSMMTKGQKRLKQGKRLAQKPPSATLKSAQARAQATPSFPAAQGVIEVSPALQMPAETLILNVDGQGFDTGIETEGLSEEMIMEYLLAGQTDPESRGYGELLAQILMRDDAPEKYQNLFGVREGRFVVDPRAETLKGGDFMEIINKVRQPGETLSEFLASFQIETEQYEEELEELDEEEEALAQEQERLLQM